MGLEWWSEDVDASPDPNTTCLEVLLMAQPISIINTERFWGFVLPWAPSGCWEWTGRKDRGGYGELQQRCGSARFYWRAHRASYELLVGPIPEGLDLDHLCRNRTCVNPDHLEPVTRQENLRRGRRHGRRIGPSGHPVCSNDHVLSPGNYRVDKKGYWVCKQCASDGFAAYLQRKEAKKAA